MLACNGCPGPGGSGCVDALQRRHLVPPLSVRLIVACHAQHGGAFGVLAVLFGFYLGFNGFEVDEPGFEDGLGDLFESLVDLAVEFDFVV